MNFRTSKSSVNEQQAFEISNPIIPNKLSDSTQRILNERIGDEYLAYFFYRNAANWCKGVNYPKAGAFFEKEAEGELSHAKGLQDYLTQWNCVPMIPAAPTSYVFSSLIDVINQAYNIEYELLKKYENDQRIFSENDPVSFNFIQKYVNIQLDEVSEYSDYLNALQLINTNSRLDIMFFEDKYF